MSRMPGIAEANSQADFRAACGPECCSDCLFFLEQWSIDYYPEQVFGRCLLLPEALIVSGMVCNYYVNVLDF